MKGCVHTRGFTGTLLLCIWLAAAAAGCAAPGRQLTSDEWATVTSRTYTGVAREEILDAAEKLFRLADGDDFAIDRAGDGMTATRSWLAYTALTAASGSDTWKFDVQPVGAGYTATVQVSTRVQPSGVGPGPSGTPAADLPVDGTALDLFWSRMDYLLGMRPDWMDCRMADERQRQGAVWGSTEALCNSFNMKDQKPAEPLVKNRRR